MTRTSYESYVTHWTYAELDPINNSRAKDNYYSNQTVKCKDEVQQPVW